MVKRTDGVNVDLGFEAKLWKAADKLRSNMDAAEYKHVVLGLIFLKYVSDSFAELYNKLQQDTKSDPEDIDEYIAKRVFWVPKKARWKHLEDHAKESEIGEIIDDAMDSIENKNTSLRGVLQKNYARPSLNKQRLGELIDLIGTIGLGDKDSQNKDILGRVYEYFLGQFADAEGKKGGQFYTPRSIVNLLVEILEPYKGRIFDPCCGSGGMFVQSEKFINAHGGKINNVSIYGQESNQTTWKLCKMNLAMRRIESNSIVWNGQGSFLNDGHKDLRADFILANPPFNDSDWGGELLQDDVRWKFGIPPNNNANFAWIQHFINHLSPAGHAGFVLSNGSMSSNSSGEGEIRKNIVENDLIDCMISLPSQLFYNTQIPACLWFINKNKNDGKSRKRVKETLFIDARKIFTPIDRAHNELSKQQIQKITRTYGSFIGKEGYSKYKNIAGYCCVATITDIEKNNFVLTPGRYVGSEEIEEDNEIFQDKMKRLTQEYSKLSAESKELDIEIRKNLREIDFEI